MTENEATIRRYWQELWSEGHTEIAAEIYAATCYDGVYALSEAALAEEGSLAGDFGALGGWIASSLVKLGDLKLEFRPPDELA